MRVTMDYITGQYKLIYGSRRTPSRVEYGASRLARLRNLLYYTSR